jgi:ketosteroid isomerase-like protein
MAAALPGAMRDDVRFLAPGQDTLRGRTAAAAWLAGAPVGALRLRWTPVQGGVSADGRTGYTFGAAAGPRADGTELHWRYISFWRRQPDGGWRIEAHMGTSAQGAAAAAPQGWPTLERGIPAGTPSPRGAAEREAVMQADRDFAAMSMARTPREAFEAFAAPWGALASGPEYGPAQIGQGFSRPSVIEWGPVMGEAAGSGDLGYTIGLAKFTFTRPDGTPGTAYSKYLSVWQRQADGSWRYVVDGGNPRPAPAG